MYFSKYKKGKRKKEKKKFRKKILYAHLRMVIPHFPKSLNTLCPKKRVYTDSYIGRNKTLLLS